MQREKDENNRKRPWLAHFLKKRRQIIYLRYAVSTKTMFFTPESSNASSDLDSVLAEAKCLLKIFNDVLVKNANLSATFLL